MWNAITPSAEWAESHVPQVIRQFVEKKKKKNSVDADEKDEEDGEEEDEETPNGAVDAQAIEQAHAYILAGCCMSVGLKFAGTAVGFF